MKLLSQTLNLPGGSISGPLGSDMGSIGSIISKAIPYVVGIASIALLLMIVASGITLMTSAGDAKKVEGGKQRLTYSIIGFFIILAAYWLVQILGRIFGIQEIINVFG